MRLLTTGFGFRRFFVVVSVISTVCVALAIYLSVRIARWQLQRRSMAVSLLDAATQSILFAASGGASPLPLKLSRGRPGVGLRPRP